jgi:hypothetical protein
MTQQDMDNVRVYVYSLSLIELGRLVEYYKTRTLPLGVKANLVISYTEVLAYERYTREQLKNNLDII